MADKRTYTDEELVVAVAESTSWRGVMRALGLKATSAGSKRSVQRHANRLGLDYGHFLGNRRWSEDDLVMAIADSASWSEVVRKLGLQGGSSVTSLKGHALRLGINTDHFGDVPIGPTLESPVPDLENLRRAGGVMAATWFILSGHHVSWPLEPCRFDLLNLRWRLNEESPGQNDDSKDSF